MSYLGLLLPLAALVALGSATYPIFEDLNPHEIPVEVLDTEYRLPQVAVPTAYKIELDTLLEESDLYYVGKSVITVKVNQKTKVLTLHAKGLTIKNETLSVSHKTVGADKKPVTEVIKAVHYSVDTTTDFLTITFEKELEVKEYELNIEYASKLNEQLSGYYKSYYVDKLGNKKWLATTHFEPVGARRAFPCWDEPAFKATFDITLTHAPKYHAVSNMPLAKPSEKVGDKMRSTFKTTPIMSTYLIAFVVSDYDHVKNQDESFRVWTRPEAVETAKYALNISQLELQKLDEFTGIKYSDYIPKMEQISIPQFSAGAMENWGLVTYRESALLYEANVTTTTAKQGIATVISHEFAHQWFGNLVTPTWWKYIWLNEGFATFFQYYTTHQVEPSWRLLEQFVVKVLQSSAFVADAQESSRAMNHDVTTQKQISSLFDAISYQKAGSVIRMMSHFLTEPVFKNGLQKYLQACKLKTADSDELFKHLQTAATESKLFPKDFDMKTTMDAWVNKPGYPVVNVIRKNQSDEVEVTQERFLMASNKDKTTWYVPLNYATENEPNFDNTTAAEWLKPDGKAVTIKGLNASQWVIFNKQQTGYYRVNYDNENWNLLAKYLNTDDRIKIHSVNRAQLIDDALNLARAGRLNYVTALEITTYLAKESDYIPWSSAFSGLRYLTRMMVHSKHYETLQRYILHLVGNLAETVKLEAAADDGHIVKLNRIQALKWACEFGSEACNKHAQEKIADWLKDVKTNTLDTDLKEVLLCSAARNAKEDTWNSMLGVYLNSTDQNEKKAVLSALGCTNTEKILVGYLQKVVDPNGEIKDFDGVFKAVVEGSPNGVNVALNILVDNAGKMEITNDKMKSYLASIASRITTIDQYVKLSLFVAREKIATEVSSNAIRTAAQNLVWLNVHQNEIEHFLEDKQKTILKKNSASSMTLASFLVILPIVIARLY
ncbi:hypothetical protein KM043_010858 [Ampulex compressa]|nr:hypothetical protein KM043_010858 [Ampulex compressa]